MNARARHPLVLIGNALSLMVAATRLAAVGVAVTIINGSKNWGGHFSTVSCNGIPFDPGMVLHEFTSFRPRVDNADPLTYNPSVKNDCGRFCDVVHDYVANYQQTREIPTPSMYVGGAVYDDILIANSLASLKDLAFADTIESELVAILGHANTSPIHASRKYVSADFYKLDFENVSVANHGATLHGALFEPFCKKLLNVSTREVVALYHRVAWLPLYYPETLLSQVRGTPQLLPRTAFSYPQHECVGDLASKLRTEMDASGLITVINERPMRVGRRGDGSYEIDFLEHSGLAAGNIAWANSTGDLLPILGCEHPAETYQRCSIALAFLRIPSESLQRDFTVLTVVDPEYVIYRITNQSSCAGHDSGFSSLVAEINPDYALGLGVSTTSLDRRIAEELVALGITNDFESVEILQTRHMRNALMLPNAGNMAGCALEMAAIREAAPDIELLGPASGFFVSSFNDQIVQGLKLAATWSSRS